MKNFNLLLISFASAFMATLCCLPALLFLIFGFSFTAFGFAENLAEFRTLLSVISVICFMLWAFYVFKKQKSCPLNRSYKKLALVCLILAIFIGFLLSYPEILGAIYA